MFEKYFADFALMAFSPEQINVSSMLLPANTSVICYLPTALRWLKTKSKSFRIGPNLGSPRHPILPQLHELLPSFHSQIFKDRFAPHGTNSKSVPWHFTEECHLAFNTLKKAFTITLVLTHWIPDTQITVETDASDYTLAAVLSITTPLGKLHPVAFHSRTFKTAEHNYDVHDKELCVIYKAFQRWRHYLEGSSTPVNVITDHRNIQYFSTTRSSRDARQDGPNTFRPST